MTLDLQTIATFGTFIFMGVTAVALWYNGRNEKKSTGLDDATKTIEILNQRIDAQNKRIDDLRTDLTAEHEAVIRLQTELKLKDQTIKEYLDILQNRDPALAEYMKSSSKALESLVAGVGKLLEIERTVTVTTK
jgi:hypothetical protein